jgi:hypothetical protein
MGNMYMLLSPDFYVMRISGLCTVLLFWIPAVVQLWYIATTSLLCLVDVTDQTDMS